LFALVMKSLSIRLLPALALVLLIVAVVGAPTPEIATSTRNILRCNYCWVGFNVCRTHILKQCAYIKNGYWIYAFVLHKGRWIRKCSVLSYNQAMNVCNVRVNTCIANCRRSLASYIPPANSGISRPLGSGTLNPQPINTDAVHAWRN